MMLSSVVFPDPFGPMKTDDAVCLHRKRHSLERDDAAEVLADSVDREQRLRWRCVHGIGITGAAVCASFGHSTWFLPLLYCRTTSLNTGVPSSW